MKNPVEIDIIDKDDNDKILYTLIYTLSFEKFIFPYSFTFISKDSFNI